MTQKVDSYVTGSCNQQTWQDAMSYELLWLNIPIIILSATYFILSVKAVVISVQTFVSIKKRQRSFEQSSRNLRSVRWKGPPVTWRSMSAADKCQFFSVWFVLTMISTACLFFVSFSNFINVKSHSPTEDVYKMLSGSGCALIWFSLLRYFEHNRGFYILVATLKRGVPRVARFMVGVMPMMLGYAFFGMVCFGSFSDRFESFSAAMITLFAVLNGDVIRETFLNLADKSPYVSQIYMYTFICLFIYVVLNVFIAIIEEAFFSAWEQGKTDKEKKSDSDSGGHGSGHGSGHDEGSRLSSPSSGSKDQHHGLGCGHDHGHGHGHGAASTASTDQRRSQAQMFSQGQMFTGSDGGGVGGSKKRGVTPNKPILPTASFQIRPEGVDSSAPVEQSWTRFREILHNVEQEELEQRHALLHEEDQLMHEELERRRHSFELGGGRESEE